jgi:hypothetical protein
MRKIFVNVQVKLVINADEDATLSNILEEMDYSFTDQTGKADVEDSEILDWDVVDSK